MAYGAQQSIEMACGTGVFGQSAATRHRNRCAECQDDDARQADHLAGEAGAAAHLAELDAETAGRAESMRRGSAAYLAGEASHRDARNMGDSLAAQFEDAMQDAADELDVTIAACQTIAELHLLRSEISGEVVEATWTGDDGWYYMAGLTHDGYFEVTRNGGDRSEWHNCGQVLERDLLAVIASGRDMGAVHQATIEEDELEQARAEAADLQAHAPH
jgi:hypothetical protein